MSRYGHTWHRNRCGLVAGLALIGVAACTGQDSRQPPPPVVTAAPQGVVPQHIDVLPTELVTPMAPVPRSKPAQSSASLPPEEGTQATAPSSSPPPGSSATASTGELPPSMLDPASLVGLDEAEMADLLGHPTTMQERPPAHSWRYASQACVLDVFFYMDVTTQNFRALSYELKSNDHEPDIRQRCFAELLAQGADRVRP